MTEREEQAEIPTSASPIFFTQRLPASLSAGLYHLLRLGLAAIFILAGFLKIRDPGAFAHAIAQYDLVPNGVIPVLAIGLPVVEFLAGLGLMLDRKGSLAVIAGLMLVFVGVLGYAIVNDLDIDCGCFTLEELQERTTVKQALYRDLVMLAAIAFLYRWRLLRSRSTSKIFYKISLKGEINDL